MKKELLLPALALAGGCAGFGLRLWQFSAAFDPEMRLFASFAPATLALLALFTGIMVLFLGLLRGEGQELEHYASAFRCPSAVYMTLTVTGGLLLMAAAALGLFEHGAQVAAYGFGPAGGDLVSLITAGLCLASGICVLSLGRGNYRGTLPKSYPLLTTIPGYTTLLWLVSLYQTDSRQPEMMLYLIHLLGAVCTALALYFASAFAFQRPRPRLCALFSLMGVVLLCTSLADRPGKFEMLVSLGWLLLLLSQSYALLCNRFRRWPRRLLDLQNFVRAQNEVPDFSSSED